MRRGSAVLMWRSGWDWRFEMRRMEWDEMGWDFRNCRAGWGGVGLGE